MRMNRASAPLGLVLVSLLAGCPEDAANQSDGGSNVHPIPRPDSGMVACPKNTPDFVVGEEDGLSADSQRGTYRARVIAAKPDVPVIKTQSDWTIQLSDAEGNPVDTTIAAACAYMPVHGHGLPPYDGIEKLDEPGQYKLKGLFFKMSGPWEVQLAVDPAGEGETPASYTSCDTMKKRPGKDYVVLNLCLADD
jgi:hypothetical protein